MAKRRTKKPKASSLPSIDHDTAPSMPPTVIEAEDQATNKVLAVPTAVPEMETIVSKPEPELKDDTMSTKVKTLDIPLASLRHGYEPRRCDVQAMTGRQPEMLKRLMNGLIAESAKLANGRLVKREQDAIKWLLEQLAE